MTEQLSVDRELEQLKAKIARLEAEFDGNEAVKAAERELANAVPKAPRPSEHTKIAERFNEARFGFAWRRRRKPSGPIANSSNGPRRNATNSSSVSASWTRRAARRRSGTAGRWRRSPPTGRHSRKSSASCLLRYEDLLRTPERLEALERLAEEELAETLPVGIARSAKEVLEARRKWARVRAV